MRAIFDRSRLLLVVSLVLLAFAQLVQAADFITATKSKNPDSSYTTGGTTSFSIATDQVVGWQAEYFGSGLDGNDFYLHQAGQLLNQIPLSTGLSSGVSSGEVFLSAGNYDISITFWGMGAGNYTINYNRTASIGISPTTHNFGNVLEGDSSGNTTFTVSSTGDLPVSLSGLNATNGQFQITNSVVGQTVPPSQTFQVRCNAGTTLGVQSANINVTGTSDAGAANATATVSCNVEVKEPNISCSGNPNLGSADWSVSEVVGVSRGYTNTGNDDLVISSVLVVNDSVGGVFTVNGVPSLAPLAAGNNRSVNMNFAPAAETNYSGHLVINSNDPDEPVKQCFFNATGHQPVPIMRLESTLLDYHQVELGFEFTKAIIVHNDGDATLNLNVADVVPLSADAPQWSTRETGSSNLAAGDEVIFRQIYAPQSTTTHSTQLVVSGNDLSNPSQTVTLIGEGTPGVPIDAVLILDRSGSMSDPAGAGSKIQALQRAAALFTDLLGTRSQNVPAAEADQIGFVRYNDLNDIYLSLDAAIDPHLASAQNQLSNAAISDVNRLGPDGDTGIGGAIETAAGMLVGSATDRKHVAVVLTDGKENTDPEIGTVIGPVQAADSLLRLYSVGLGSDIEADKLQLITNTSNGYHQVTDNLSGTSIFDLEQFYFKIFSDAADWQLVVDPTFIVNISTPTPVIIDTAKIISSDRSATFLVLDSPALRSMYDLELIDPHGQVMLLGSTIGGIPVHQMQRHTYSIYRIVFPDVAQANSYVGNWILRLTPNGKWNPDEFRETKTHAIQGSGGGINLVQGDVPVGFAAAVASNYRLQVELLASHYLPGAQITMTAALSDRDWPAVDGEVKVDVTRPDGTVHHDIKLFDDGSHGDVEAGDATWTNRFIQTGASGSYQFFFHALGKNERGELAPREATRYVSLVPPTVDNGGGDHEECIPCELLRWLWAIVIGLLLLLLLCCYRKKLG